MTAHGGDVARAAREAGIPAERILDFSANVNPRGLPERAMWRLARDAGDGQLLMRYPERDAPELRLAIAAKLGVAEASVVIGAGADALIHAAVRAFTPRRASLPVPGFSEYTRACRAVGCAIGTETGPGDLLILNNPHNPTGACLDRAGMLARIDSARLRGVSVLADEAFIDYIPAAAITLDAATREGVIAIRSLTKFFGCPGLRVGYAVAAPETAVALASQLPAWPVTTLALGALAEALGDDEYARETIERNVRARESLAAALNGLGCRASPSSANFLLIEVPHAGDVRARLLREHAILVRECDSFEGLERGRYLRVAVRLEKENARLLEGLASVLGES